MTISSTIADVNKKLVTMGNDKSSFIAPAVLAGLISFGDFIDAPLYPIIIYIITCVVYMYMFYRYCESSTEEKLEVGPSPSPSPLHAKSDMADWLNKNGTKMLHAFVKGIIFIGASVIIFKVVSFVLYFIPIVGWIIRLIPLIPSMVLHYGIYLMVYILILILNQYACPK